MLLTACKQDLFGIYINHIQYAICCSQIIATKSDQKSTISTQARRM